MAKDVKDIFIAAATISKSTIQATADGKFEIGSDAKYYTDDIDEILEAWDGKENIRSQLEAMTKAEKDDIFDSVRDVLGEYASNDTVDDVIDVAQGVLALGRIALRANKKNNIEGAEEEE